MAQVGCFVPAQVFRLTPIDSLHVQMGSEEHFETNSSSFHAEMQQLSYISSSLSSGKRALVCFDELGRSTSIAEGRAIFQATVESFVADGALSIFVTHFDDLAETLAEQYPSVRYIEMLASLGDDGQIIPTYRAQTQGSHGSLPPNYGIKLAVVAAFPYRVIQEALTIRALLASRRRAGSEAGDRTKVIRQGKMIVDILERNQLEPEKQLEMLVQIQDELGR